MIAASVLLQGCGYFGSFDTYKFKVQLENLGADDISVSAKMDTRNSGEVTCNDYSGDVEKMQIAPAASELLSLSIDCNEDAHGDAEIKISMSGLPTTIYLRHLNSFAIVGQQLKPEIQILARYGDEVHRLAVSDSDLPDFDTYRHFNDGVSGVFSRRHNGDLAQDTVYGTGAKPSSYNAYNYEVVLEDGLNDGDEIEVYYPRHFFEAREDTKFAYSESPEFEGYTGVSETVVKYGGNISISSSDRATVTCDSAECQVSVTRPK
jgi:hypothetical protein